ncbi:MULTISPECIES: transporter substrate-binding domain-containing protein [Pseudomonas]|uniref:transporter substrate-binding domain-containing protein n=1 Tax=Pseudomonas TaxID=286 RepID=UPI0015A018B3|nr:MULTISPECIES: transporter substrate-binding domain-containing protein [Pseudomonas]NWA10967.1 transporter substrate-binding domain-containing protein [Pseudomonas gingeri]BBP76682.1 nopaline-binding periplasmic protein [Pseudomonas sp. Ost2]
MSLKEVLLGSLLCSGLWVSASYATEAPVLKIATEGAYAPWNFTRPGGQLDGFEIDLARELCDRMKARCEVVAQDWDGLIPSLNAGKFDAIMAGMSITEKRQQVIGFSRPYAAPLNGFLVMDQGTLTGLPGAGRSVDLDQDEAGAKALVEQMRPLLKGRVLGVQGSTTASAFAEKYLADLVEVREYKTVDAHNLDLLSGRIDAVLANAVVLKLATEAADMHGSKMAGPIFAGGVFGPGIGVGLRKNDDALKARFDQAITAAVADGTVRRLSEKWLKLDVTPLK